MRAIVINSPGGPEALQVQEVPAPVPGPGEVLIDVAAAGLNRADVLQRQGHYPVPAGSSEYPGLEVSGRIAAVGTGVEGLSVGADVVALLTGGGYADQVNVPAGQVLPVPAGLDLVTAAALPETAATVFSNLFMAAGVTEGDHVLIHGGAGGIGTMAIQMVAAFGAVPMVTAGSPEKLELARSLGAQVLINYKTEDFVARVREVTDGRGADVILDVIGAKYLQRNLEALAVSGRLVIIGLQGGTKAEIDLNLLMRKRLAVIGTTLRARPTEEKAAIMQAVKQYVWPLVEAGKIRPLVDKTFPLAEAAAAHEYFDSGVHTGKILLTT
ncbi:NAD(P)H-quinone oxidoreductase [Arthrobacter sunyaminii]|uniref:NAD(P)H-quinone oxidoreductase n=1 Tax=Arthrobacter sunyaminii TaxID=2816859 RepID=A0A975S6B0_9MICC|nr:NAD(P)H-quinone oxidoreductase [Arthrobacter sunyaminii]MBO0898004.1 NAD(P)H-quinone oxidoreductase [Arthrobacter sunyaminii]MBO0909837.1 NAD(P)H-quinone oxidoreductase [Arthrobacter sunyaminii]QWQ36627.1 NAD(P)H-quinone oxidoreductase [Arthrobacter sunyaminii]